MKALLWDYIFPGFLIIVLFITMYLFRPTEIPPLWFDEGWTLTVARNWVETGQYARFLEGIPISADGMLKSLSVTSPIALSFSLFGVGVPQGRLPAMLSMALALFCIFQLTRKVYNVKVAYLSLIVLLFMSSPLNPWIIGKQAAVEAPMVFYLSAGYLFFMDSLNGKKYAIIGAIICWGLAMDSKVHAIPFWSISMLLPMAIIFVRKQWQVLKFFGFALVGSYAVYFPLFGIQNTLYDQYPLYIGVIRG